MSEATQFLTDANGAKVAAVIPIEEYEKLFEFRKLAGASLLAAVCVSGLSAESPNVSPVALSSLQHGLTQQQVEERLKARGDHEFTAAFSNGIARWISYYRNDVYGHYYLVL